MPILFTSSPVSVLALSTLQVPRQRLIQVDLLDKLPLGVVDLQVPAEGMTVPHIRSDFVSLSTWP